MAPKGHFDHWHPSKRERIGLDKSNESSLRIREKGIEFYRYWAHWIRFLYEYKRIDHMFIALYIECDIKNTWPICNYEFKRIGHTFIALYIGYDTKSKWPIRNYEFKRIGRPLIALYIGCDTKSKWSIRTYGFKRIDRTFYFYAHWLGYRKQIANP